MSRFGLVAVGSMHRRRYRSHNEQLFYESINEHLMEPQRRNTQATRRVNIALYNVLRALWRSKQQAGTPFTNIGWL